uniref:Uncharacterized protein n=1 Tax=Arundo donax TaxID=35708 RepID=A0A0A9B8C5_ARUDO
MGTQFRIKDDLNLGLSRELNEITEFMLGLPASGTSLG